MWSANDPPNASTVANIQNTTHRISMGMKPEYTPHIALGVLLAAAHTQDKVNSVCKLWRKWGKWVL